MTGQATYFLLTVELLIRDVGRQVGVEESAEGQAITPAAAEVGDIDVLGGRSSIISLQSGQSQRIWMKLWEEGVAGRQGKKPPKTPERALVWGPAMAWCHPNAFTQEHGKKKKKAFRAENPGEFLPALWHVKSSETSYSRIDPPS